LVINGDFEFLKDGPRDIESIKVCPEDWISLNSIDVYSNIERISNVDCKSSLLKSQSGNHFVGLANFDITIPNYREFIVGKLKNPILKDHKYLLRFYFAYGKKASFLSTKLNVFLLDSIVSVNDLSGVLKDSINIPISKKIKAEKWVEFIDTITATKNSNYIGLGDLDFNDKSNNVFIRKRFENCPGSYFFLDNVSLLPLLNENDSGNASEFINKDFLKFDNSGDSYRSFSIKFKFNSADILDEYNDTLKMLIGILKSTTLKLELIGYTDSIGSYNYNIELSKRRVFAIRDQLISNNIIDKRITYSYLGSLNPLNDNSTEEDRTKNRRVEIKLTE
jgi:outer membrane protein OmpA-like peptidoglycan-associated protein